MLIWKNRKQLFEEVALPHVEAAYRFALHLCGNEADAQDLTQDCFHRAYRNFHRFQQGTNCRAWLFTIARNANIDRMRRKSREPVVVELREETDCVVQDSESPWERDRELNWLESGPEEAIDDEDVFFDLFGDEVNHFLSQLTREFRLALVLCDVEGFSYSEISEILRCPIGTVRSRIARAREFLKAQLYTYAKSLGYVRGEPV